MQKEVDFRQETAPEIFEFGDFRLDVREHVLESVDSGERVSIPDKAFDTLAVLVRKAGRLVEKDELLNTVWADSFVEENNLNKSIHAIRRALGENEDRKYVETVKKYGFRFVAEVKPIKRVSAEAPTPVRMFPRAVPDVDPDIDPDIDSSSESTAVVPVRTSNLKRTVLFAVVIAAAIAATGLIYRYVSNSNQDTPLSLAILPLKPIDASDNYLGLGVADAIIRRISQTGTLTVRPTSSVRRYLNEDTDALTAARDLGVDAVLEGTLQRAGDKLRVSVNLLHVSDGQSLWAENFDMNTSDVFAVQDKVAQEVATRLRLRLDPAQRDRLTARYTPDAIAYEYYLKGVYSFEQRGFRIEAKPQHETTINLFKKSVEADPKYALAHAQLAYAYAWMALYVDESKQDEWVELAKAEIQRADAIDPQLAETRLARHHVLLSAHEGFQTEAAIRELIEAKKLDPNFAAVDLSVAYNHLGLEDMFDREMQRTFQVDPTSEFNKLIFGYQLMFARRYDDWQAYSQKHFGGKTNVQYLLGTGRLDDAGQRINLMPVSDRLDATERGEDFRAILLALRGDHTAAQAAIPQLIRDLPFGNNHYHHATYNIACIYALGGKSEEAVKWLRETAATGFPSYPMFERDRFLDPIRQTHEFVQFMTDLKSQYDKYRQEFAQ